MKSATTLANEPGQTPLNVSQIQAQFDALLNAAADAIIIIDHRGIIETFNAAAETLFGYQTKDIIGKNISMLMPEPYAAQHDQFMANYHKTRKAKIIGIGREVQAQKSNGEVFPIELSVGEIDLRGLGLEHNKYVGIIRDITTRVEAQREARESRERLAHVTRVNTMGEMASGIAHEINQPLAAISSYAQAANNLLRKPSVEKTEIAAVLEKIGDQAIRAGEVIRRLRAFFKKRKGENEHSNINEIIRESVNIGHADTRVLDHPIIMELDQDLPLVNVDPVQIQQVVLNLLRNAIDAMEHKPGEPVTILATEYDEDFVQVTVKDNGGGIDPEMSTNLFNPFYSTKASGMGMGLAICQSIVKSHGGKLWYAPADRGSIFAFTIPKAPE